jgi:hypothetical protein
MSHAHPRNKGMMKHRQHWTIAGDGWLVERAIFGFMFYRRRRDQHWSPAMHEIEIEYGLRVSGMRLSFSRVAKHFFDGKEPSVVAGPY